ncbi:MAG: TVP38/TMEM64 family protein [Verrucomicrobia bacterium]|nr:TVP38/TMEM64 family protein [Cytophagales bacterium]
MKKLPVIISISVLGLMVLLYFTVSGFRDFIEEGFEVLVDSDQERARNWIGNFGVAGPFIIILGITVQMFLFIVPNVLLLMIAIISYGPIWGSLISLVGVFASSTLGYLIGQYLGPVTVNKILGDKTKNKITGFLQEYGFAAIAITRVSSLSNDSLSIVAGLLKMSYKKYIAATMLGITPLIVVLAIFGRNGRILNSLIWIGLFSIAGLILYVYIDRKKKKSPTASTENTN